MHLGGGGAAPVAPPMVPPTGEGSATYGIVGRQTPPPVDRMTDTIENITLPHTSYAGSVLRFINKAMWTIVDFQNVLSVVVANISEMRETL